MENDFKFEDDEWVLVDGVLGQVTRTSFCSTEPDAYRIKFKDGSQRWFYEDMISTPTRH